MAPPLAPVMERTPPAETGSTVKRFSGDRLKALREDQGLTQVELAQRTAIPLPTIRNWEQGRSVPSVERLARVAIALGTRADDLLADTEDEV